MSTASEDISGIMFNDTPSKYKPMNYAMLQQ